MRFLALFALALFGTVQCKTLHHQLDNYSFEDYVREYGKVYDDTEFETRKLIFQNRLESIRSHNNDNSKSHAWKQGVNHLTDYTQSEINALFGYNKHSAFRSKVRQEKSKAQGHLFRHKKNKKQLPVSVDWRINNVVSPVKDQGQCGSCWTFGTAETIESHYAIKYGHLTELSEQQILDCTANPNECGGKGGCSGGTPELGYAQIQKLGGLSSEWSYPYRSYFGVDYPTCSFNNTKTRPVAQVSDYVVLPSNEEEPILDALANKGPVVIAVDASLFHSYESGIFTSCNATSIDLNHAVVITGYGHDQATNKDYWTVRNSWSPLWGEDGYIRIERTSGCGVDSSPGDGVGCSDGPATVKACGPCGLFYDVSYPIIG